MSKKEINLSEKANSKKAKKNPKSKKATEVVGTKEVAKHLEISPFSLRQILRSEGFFPDGGYTRYGFKSLKDPIVKKLEGIVEKRKTTKAKSKKKIRKTTKAKSKKKIRKTTKAKSKKKIRKTTKAKSKKKTKKDRAKDKVKWAVKTATHRPVR